jgi:hypothetical protein
VTQISSQHSLLSSVDSFTINKPYKMQTGEEDVDSTQWLEFFWLFTHMKQVNVWDSEKRLVPRIVQVQVTEDMAIEVLPDLTSPYLKGYRPYRSARSLAKAAERFVATRALSGRTVYLFD